MYLVASPLIDAPAQRFEIAISRRIAVTRVAVWIYINDIDNADTFVFTLENETINQNIMTKTYTGAELKTAINCTDTYGHGKLFINVGYDFHLGRGAYTLRGYQTSGYTVNKYASLCKDWESPYLPSSTVPTGDWQDAYYLRIYDKEGRQV
jgi:hypothetical protein